MVRSDRGIDAPRARQTEIDSTVNKLRRLHQEACDYYQTCLCCKFMMWESTSKRSTNRLQCTNLLPKVKNIFALTGKMLPLPTADYIGIKQLQSWLSSLLPVPAAKGLLKSVEDPGTAQTNCTHRFHSNVRYHPNLEPYY